MLVEHPGAGWMPDSHGHAALRRGTAEMLLTKNRAVGAQGRETPEGRWIIVQGQES